MYISWFCGLDVLGSCVVLFWATLCHEFRFELQSDSCLLADLRRCAWKINSTKQHERIICIGLSGIVDQRTSDTWSIDPALSIVSPQARPSTYLIGGHAEDRRFGIDHQAQPCRCTAGPCGIDLVPRRSCFARLTKTSWRRSVETCS